MPARLSLKRVRKIAATFLPTHKYARDNPVISRSFFEICARSMTGETPVALVEPS